MSTYLATAASLAVMVAILAFAAYWGRRRALESVAKAEDEVGRILRDAQKDAENLKKEALLEAKEANYNLRADFEKHTRDRLQELNALEGRLAQKENALEEVVWAMEAHHLDREFRILESMRVQAADAISASRPGARRDLFESYVKRLERLESIATSFNGVSKAFALQAGREIRVLVEAEKISDEEMVWLSKDVARRIESELQCTRDRSKSPSSVRPVRSTSRKDAPPLAPLAPLAL